VLELHHTSTAPGSVACRPGVAVESDDVVAATSQHRPQREARWSGAYDDHFHFCSF
jgi:hypothetical protein